MRLLLCLVLLAGCDPEESEPPPDEPLIPDPPAGSLLDAPLGAFPAKLSDAGLFPLAPDLGKVPAVAHVYTPAWEFWSNGLHKVRHVVVPKGAAVDTSDRTDWQFPVGTLFFKTFSDDDGPVETRVLRLGAEGWELGSYQWAEDGKDAQLLDGKMGVPIDVAIDGAPFEHRIPNRLECRECHESSPSPVLAFSELRLNHELGGSETELARMFDQGVLGGSLPDDPDEIDEPDPARREVRAYLHGNCSFCHNGTMGVSSSFDLRHDVALENTIGVPTDSSASAAGIRIVPGEPLESILFLAFSGETEDPEVKPMPPVAIERRDAQAVEQLRDFIEGLPTP